MILLIIVLVLVFGFGGGHYYGGGNPVYSGGFSIGGLVLVLLVLYLLGFLRQVP
jgi:hypothetical protein